MKNPSQEYAGPCVGGPLHGKCYVISNRLDFCVADPPDPEFYARVVHGGTQTPVIRAAGVVHQYGYVQIPDGLGVWVLSGCRFGLLPPKGHVTRG